MTKINPVNKIFFLILSIGIFVFVLFSFSNEDVSTYKPTDNIEVVLSEEVEVTTPDFSPIIEEEIIPKINLIPEKVIQGEPVLIQVEGASMTDIENFSFNGKTLKIFNYENKPSAFVGIDLNKKVGNYKISLDLKSGDSTSTILAVLEREKYEEPLPIPDSLGGNSPANQTKVVSTLSTENAILASLSTGAKAFWGEKFIYPVKDPFVTDTYGYSRGTGNYTITHKGVDFRAKEGTEVYAMNRGVVRLAKEMTVYGNTVVVDHGFGLLTYYMHLSKLLVNEGQLVLPGQIIGLSGATGFSTGPHLHISVKIDGISIDPIKFLEIFK
jgi:murein DD-endopeptidase MepM/ murein hydrolase activator NlpD